MFGASILQRWVYLFFIALCIAVLMGSPDYTTRILAVVGLVVFAQLREVALLDEVTTTYEMYNKQKACKAEEQKGSPGSGAHSA